MPSTFTPRRGRGSVTVPLDEPKPFTYSRRGTAPTAAERAEAAAQNKRLKNTKVSPAEGRVIASANRSEGGGKAKGGKVVKKATKAGKAMIKKSADTMGRAMKFAKGGSIDGCATKGKTKAKMVKMCSGGSMKKGR